MQRTCRGEAYTDGSDESVTATTSTCKLSPIATFAPDICWSNFTQLCCRTQEHRGKSAEELAAFSNRGYEEIMEFAKSAAGSAVGVAGAGAGAVEATMWSLLADGADQRLVGNQFKQQLQDMMQKKLEQLDSTTNEKRMLQK